MAHSDSNQAWHRQDAVSILRALGTTADSGLTAAEADARLATTGPNEIEGDKPPTFLRLLINQLADFMTP